MSEVVAVVTSDQAERGGLDRDWRNQYLAVRSLPENEKTIRYMFGDKIVKGGDSDAYDWQIQAHVNSGWRPPSFRFGANKGLCQQDVQQGDWILLSPFGLIHSYTPEKFEAEWFITGAVLAPRVSDSINTDHLPPESEWDNYDTLPPKSEWTKIYSRENQ